MSFATRRPLIRTLRARLTILHLTTLAVTLAVFSVLAYVVLSRTLSRHHDEELEHEAEELVRGLSGTALTDAGIQRAILESRVGSRLVMVRDARGGLIYRDRILEATEPNLGEHQALVHAAAKGSQQPEFFTTNLERAGEVRFICAPLKGQPGYVQIGDPVGDVRTTRYTIARACLPLIPLVLLLSSYGGWLMANRALSPMRSVTATLREIQATDLARRVEVRAADQEIDDLVATLNHLLSRLQRAFDSLRQFAGDVSHQLQTPLTVLRANVEGAVRRDDPNSGEQRLVDLIAEIDDMSATVSNLRAFALADAPVTTAEPVDLSHVVEETAEILAALGELSGVDVTTTVRQGLKVGGDTTRLKQVVLNLGDNAIKFTSAGGQVALRLSASSSEAILEVFDTGVGISPDELPHLFDRLFRGTSRTMGSGLGLAIVKRIVDAHRGTISVESEPTRGSKFTVRLPLVAATH